MVPCMIYGLHLGGHNCATWRVLILEKNMEVLKLFLDVD